MSAKASDVPVKGNELQVVVFNLGNEDLAFDIRCVREIIRIPEITKVPNSSDFVMGVINLRGTIKPILNIRKRLGMKNRKVNLKVGKIILVENADKDFGIIVDSVVGVTKFSPENITDPSSVLVSGKSDIEFIKGIGRTDDKLIMLLEPERLFSLEEIPAS